VRDVPTAIKSHAFHNLPIRAMRPASILACLIISAATVSTSPVGAQPVDIRSCASIPNPYERADCVRRGGSYPAPDGSASPAMRVAPSFDCKVARTSMERAICADDELAGWDARMGQAYQQAMRTQRDQRGLQDSQRNWIVQRERACSSSSGITFSCLLEMTKQRTAALAQMVATAVPPAPAPSLTPTPTPIPTIVPQVSNPPPASSENPAQTAPSANAAIPATPSKSGDDGPIKGILFALFLGSLYVAVKVANAARRKKLLIAKYGEATAVRIIAHEMWQGMTEEQLIDSWGSPVEIGSEVLRTKTKQVWKYGQTGKNRFSQRVTVENGIVTGWKV
jgi:uncharacterized protein YecT (DUF1311 family)